MNEPEPHLAARTIKRASRLRPALAIILGTGFAHLEDEVNIEVSLPFSQVPGFPRAGVKGHAGRLAIGTLGRTPVLLLSGRAHYYEGISMRQVTFPVRVLAACGITDLLLTNAAGGLHPRLRAGDFMILSDHINFMGINPLRDQPSADGSRYVDLSCAYDQRLSRLLVEAGKVCGLKLRRGVYLAVSGPSYETPAEIRAFARLGADAVGMSTVPEVIVARQHGLRVAGLSCITNLAAGRSQTPLSHAEVLTTAARVKNSAAQIIKHFAGLYDQ